MRSPHTNGEWTTLTATREELGTATRLRAAERERERERERKGHEWDTWGWVRRHLRLPSQFSSVQFSHSVV